MIFISYRRKAGPSEKLRRLININKLARKRNLIIQKEFQSKPSSKKLLQKINFAEKEFKRLFAEKPSKPDMRYVNKLKLAVSKHLILTLKYLKQLKKFTESENANHAYLRRLDTFIIEAEEKIIEIRNTKF